MKKLISLIVAIVLIASLASVAFAAGETGTITINGITEDNVYELYKLLDLDSYNAAEHTYSYVLVTEWTEFFTTGAGKDYVTITDGKYVTWHGDDSDATVAAFAKLALAYAKEKGISPVKSSSVAGDCEVVPIEGNKKAMKFTGLSLGYYLVDSTMGALCGLTTTNPNASINAKNGAPTIEKHVMEDDNGQWGSHNTADIGETVNFRATITVHDGAQNYVMHDKMSAGLTFLQVDKIVHVKPVAGGAPQETVASTSYYTVVQTGLGDDCSFEVRFNQSFCDHLETGDYVVVYYSAKVNADAVSGNENTNEVWLEFGDDHYTTHDSTVTKTFGFDLVKTDDQKELLNGATFRIYDAATGGNEIPMVKGSDGVYRHAEAGVPGEDIVVTGGKVRVEGLDNGIYYLEEIDAPDGYNKLTARHKFTISDGNLDAIFSDGKYSSSGVHVVNKTGNILPETGGMGTMLFITFRTLVVLGTGVLLVTKKRMGMIVE